MPSLRWIRARPHGRLIDVNDAIHEQRITGFGAAMTDSSAWLLYDELPPQTRAVVMEALFGPSGIRLDWVRAPMGGSDFTIDGVPYTYDDLEPGMTDPLLADFAISHDQAYIIPALQEVLKVNPATKIIANPWTAPSWMKANAAADNYQNLGALLPADYQAFAEYFVKFIEAYAANGIPIAAITPANEPSEASVFPAMELDADPETTFIEQYLAPALSAAGLQTPIYGLDEGGFLSYAQALLGGPAREFLSGLAWHCYGGMDLMGLVHSEFPTVDQVVSECSPGIIPYAPIEVAIDGVRNWASSIALWNLALDPAGGPVEPPNTGCPRCTGLVTISEQTHTASYGLNYYQFGQVSRFVEPGAVRIASTRLVADFRAQPAAYGIAPGPGYRYGVTSGLDDAAFLNPDGSRVLVVYNNSGARRAFAARWHQMYLSESLPGRAAVTFEWR